MREPDAGSGEPPRTHHGPDRAAVSRRLHRIEGQVRGLERMVAEERRCSDILTQLAAVAAALESLSLVLIGEHVRHVVAETLQTGDVAGARRESGHVLAAAQRRRAGAGRR